MQKTKLYNLLCQLDFKEKQYLKDYFCQPYFAQKHLALQQLLYYLLQQNTQKQPNIARKAVFEHLFGAQKPYNDLKLRHLAADVLLYTERALVCYYAILDDALWQPIQTLQLYSRKQLVKHYYSQIGSIKQILSENKKQNTDYFLQQYRFFYLQEQFNNDRTDPIKQITLSKASDALDIFYIAAKLRMTAALYTLQQLRQGKSEIGLADIVLDIVNKNAHYLQYTLVAAYYYCLKMQRNQRESEHWFEQLKILINTQYLNLPFDEAQEIYFFALNYCAVQINKGNEAYLQQIFELYQAGLNNKWLLDEGLFLSVYNYKNICTVLLRLQQYDLSYSFLHDYQSLLPAQQRQSAFTYNMANYHFYRREYDQVLQYLQDVQHDEIFYSLDARLLLLKTYYELDEIDTLHSLLESTRQLLHRTKQLSRNRQQTYRNFLKFIRKLSNLPPKAYKKMAVLYLQISECIHLADKRWLMVQTQTNS